MISHLRPHQAPTTVAIALGIALALPSSAIAAPKGFDGTWAVQLTATSGSCEPSYSATLIVEKGQVRALSGATTVIGSIQRNGVVALAIQHSIAQGEASGRLSGQTGTGTWRVVNMGCSGQWAARRQTLTAQR